MALARTGLVAWIVRRVAQLRFPVLLLVTLVLLGVNLIVPDPVPMVDELLLALGAVVLSRLRKRGGEAPGAERPEPGPPR